jgi:hypothetical protein
VYALTTSMKTWLFISANRCMGSTVTFVIFRPLLGRTIFDRYWAGVSDLCATTQPRILLPEGI